MNSQTMMTTSQNQTVLLSASARYGYGGKQFVARITGRNEKFTFERTFLGRKEGKRGEATDVRVDEPGLYQERDVDSKGRAEDSYSLVFCDDNRIIKLPINLESAMVIAKQLDGGEYIAVIAFDFVLRLVQTTYDANLTKPQDEVCEVNSALFGKIRKTCSRAEIQAERKAWLDKQNAPVNDQAARIAQVKALMIELGVAVGELS